MFSGRRLGNPMRAPLTCHAHGIQMPHETRKILEITPELIKLLLGFVDRDALCDVNERIQSALVTMEPRAAEHIHGGHARDSGSSGGEAIHIRPGLTKSGAKETKVYSIARDSSVHPRRRFGAGENADAAG